MLLEARSPQRNCQEFLPNQREIPGEDTTIALIAAREEHASQIVVDERLGVVWFDEPILKVLPLALVSDLTQQLKLLMRQVRGKLDNGYRGLLLDIGRLENQFASGSPYLTPSVRGPQFRFSQ